MEEWKSRYDKNKTRCRKQWLGEDMENVYILTIESYEWTKIYGVFTDKEILLENYLYLLEHSCDATDYPKDLGLCIYNPKLNEMYMEIYYELCEGGREEIGAKITQISLIEIWGEDVNEKITASLRIANSKKEKEITRRAVLNI